MRFRGRSVTQSFTFPPRCGTAACVTFAPYSVMSSSKPTSAFVTVCKDTGAGVCLDVCVEPTSTSGTPSAALTER